MSADFDIAICGAGPVGLSLALLLLRRGVPAARIAVIDAKPVEQAASDPRSIALSFGSLQLLDSIVAWPVAATDIHDIHVSRRGHFGRTLISRDEFDVPALGHVTRYGTLVGVLANALQRTAVTAVRRDYLQTALVAHVTAGTPIAHRAFERFTEEGPLALLPQDDGYAMVWCVRPDTATRLQALHD